MAEIGVLRAGCDDQVVERDAAAIGEAHLVRHRVDAADLAQQRRHLAAAMQQVPDRPGDFRCAEGGGGHLIEQGLEQMVVAAIDDRDVDGRAGEFVDRRQPAEAAADDHDPGSVHLRSHPGLLPARLQT